MMPAILLHASPKSKSLSGPRTLRRRTTVESTSAVELVIVAVVAIFVLGTILSGFFQVRTAEAAVVQRMGKFQRVAGAGINFKLPWLDQIAGRIDLRVQQLALDVETKTKDNVFVKIRCRCSIT